VTERKIWCKHSPPDPCEYCRDKHAEREWVTTFYLDPFGRWHERKAHLAEIERLKQRVTELEKGTK
jgi:hypothetical protein